MCGWGYRRGANELWRLVNSTRAKRPRRVPENLLLLGWAALGSDPGAATGVARLCGGGRRYCAGCLRRDGAPTAAACG